MLASVLLADMVFLGTLALSWLVTILRAQPWVEHFLCSRAGIV